MNALTQTLVPAAAALNDQIRNVAPLASITLALLTLFSNRRDAGLRDAEGNLAGVKAGELRRSLVLDVLLAAFTGVALVAMAPLFGPALAHSHIATSAGALRTMFAIIYVGFVVLLVFQFWMVWRRSGILAQKVNKTGFGKRVISLFASG